MKTFILDTNVLLYDPLALNVFEDNEVVIPISVLDELDYAKTRPDEVGRNARNAIKMLDNMRSYGSLSNGVRQEKTLIRVELNHIHDVPVGLVEEKVDNRIISVALTTQNEGKKVIVVTKDINLRVKCDAVGVFSQDYNKDKIAQNINEIYSGVKKEEVESNIIDELYQNGFIEWDHGYENQFFILKSLTNQSALTRYSNGQLLLCKDYKEVWGIRPRNAEQKMALDLLLDPKIKLITLSGFSGCGKTLLACCASLRQTIEKGNYSRILISRPIQPMGKDLGFLPGSIQEKIDPWMQPIYDNLDLLLGQDSRMIEELKHNGTLQVEALTYIRGRSIPNSFMILDEAQNLSMKEIKTVITRMGENSKIVLTGDITQIDHNYLDFSNNGLTHVVEAFKNEPIAGHITLLKGERSELATLASRLL